MATKDAGTLIVSYAADLTTYEIAARKAWGLTQSTADRIEGRFDKMNSRIDAVGNNIKRTLVASLTAITGGLTINEVIQYADAWRQAQNALRVAGLSGDELSDTLETLYDQAQKNSAPLEATIKLYGRSSQAADNLGASQEDLIKASDAVGLSLKIAGQGAQEASGALLQLSQLFQGNKVQAQEYNSLIDGLFPLLQAVASGSDRWAGSVAKLTTDVKASTVTTREFFQALLNGLPELEKRASQATQTLGQAVTKIENALTKYIGETDESLGATQRLIAGLNALADDFENIADTVLQLASVIAGALVGRAIGGALTSIPLLILSIRGLIFISGGAAVAARAMAAAFGQASSAVLAFSLAARAARLATLFAIAGPLGAVIGGLAVAFLELGTSQRKVTEETNESAKAFRELSAALDKARAANGKVKTASQEVTEALRREREEAVRVAKAKAAEIAARLSVAKAALEEAKGLRERAASESALGEFEFIGTSGEATKQLDPLVNKVGDLRIALIRVNKELAELEKLSIETSKTTQSTVEEETKKFDRALTSIHERTESLRLEAQLVGRSRQEIERRMAALALEQQLERDGVPLTKARREAIDEVSRAYADAVVEAERMARAEEFLRDTSADVFKGFVSDLKDGKTATEALHGALDRLADRLIDLATDQVIAQLFGGLTNAGVFGGGASAPGGSSFSSIVGAIFHKGGKVGSTSVPARNLPASTFANAPRLHNGLRADEFPAVLQRGEQVIPRGGNRPGSGVSVPITVNLDARGADRDAIERAVARIETEVPRRAVDAVREAQSRRAL